MVRATKYLEIIEKHRLVENAATTGRYMKNTLQSIADESEDMISNVRGEGLLIAFDLPDTATRDQLKQDMYTEDVLVLSAKIKKL